MEEAAAAASGRAADRASCRQARGSSRRTALILYGSETGNAQDVADEIGRMTERLHFDTTVLDMNSVQLRDVARSTVVLFAVSTTGQGELPQNARGFWKALLSTALKPGSLSKLRFSSFGLGDSSYALYNVAHRMLYNRLTDLGAKTICERGEGNEQHPEGHSAGFREWIALLKKHLLQIFPLPPMFEPVPDDVFIEPRWKLEMLTAGTNGESANPDVQHVSSSTPISHCLPSEVLMPIIGSFNARIESNKRLTAAQHFQDVRLVDLRVNELVPYGPGAVAVIYPKNFPEDVESFIKLMGWDDVADAEINVVAGAAASDLSVSSPSPLRHLDVADVRLTLRWLLENVLDIMSIPRRSFFAGLAHFAGESNNDETYQKERLLELANPELIDELWDYTTRPKRTILEVMMDFTTIKIPWQYALSALPIMRGRQFSIASGGRLRTDEQGRTRLQLLIAIVNPPSPIIKWRRRYGVCTRYVASLRACQQINIGIQPGYLDVQPSELQVPLVMVGPGTGLAPMRSMIHQRVQWAHMLGLSASGKALDRDILFFGCRSEATDYYFEDELRSYEEVENLTVYTAFSRDAGKSKQYVQDQILVNGARVCEAIVRQNGKVYVCGSSGNMPKGVRQAILSVLVEHTDGFTDTIAEAYLNQMEKTGRYKQETW